MKGFYLIIISIIILGFFVFHFKSLSKIGRLKEEKIKLQKELEYSRFRNLEYINNLNAQISFSLLGVNGFIDYLNREGKIGLIENCENRLIIFVPVDVCGICLNSLFIELSNTGPHCLLLITFEEDPIIERIWKSYGFSLDHYYTANNNFLDTSIRNELILLKANSNNELIKVMVYNYQLPEFLNIFLSK